MYVTNHNLRQLDLVFARIDNNPNLCTNPASCDPDPNKKKSIFRIVTATITLGIALLALFVPLPIWYKRKRAKGNRLSWLKFMNVFLLKNG